jgi:hypothetical protein
VLLDSDGSLLSVVAQGTQFNSTGPAASIYATVVDSLGGIIVTGQFDNYNGIPCGSIARLDISGNFDAAFNANVGAGFDGYTTRADIMPNGQIIVGQLTSTNTLDGQPTYGLVCLDPDGTRFTAFNNGPGYNLSTYDLTVTPLGDIVVVGLFTTLDGVSRLRVAKLS